VADVRESHIFTGGK